MKKLFQLFCAIYFLTSCSGDNGVTTYNDTTEDITLKNGPTIDPVLENLYITMINSQSYLNYDRARAAFDAKVGNAIPDSELATEDLMLRWIENNISQTGFTNYIIAENEYNNVLSLNSISLQANNGFYDYLVGTAPGSLVPVLQVQEPISAACRPCINAYNNCVNGAKHDYDKALRAAHNSLIKDDMKTWTTGTSNAVNTYMRAIGNCSNTFESCCSGGM